MDPVKVLAELRERGEALGKKSTAEWSDEDRDFAKSYPAELAAAEKSVENVRESARLAAQLVGAGEKKAADEDGDEQTAGMSLADRFVKSTAYKRFAQDATDGYTPAGATINIKSGRVGSMDDMYRGRTGSKALTSDQAFSQNTRLPMVDNSVAPRLSLLDLITRGRISTAGFEYLQITAVTRAAAIVKENTGVTATDQLKPLSELSSALVEAKVATYADGFVVSNQMLADEGALATFMDLQLRYNLDAVIEDTLINGSGTGITPRGIKNTTGVQAVDAAVGGIEQLVAGIREAIRRIDDLGGVSTGIVLNSEDAMDLDLWKQEGTGAFYGGGPFALIQKVLWGVPWVISSKVAKGEAIVGDLKQIALLDRDGLSINAFNQHEDFARRNLTYVRAELRAAQAIYKPAHLAIVTQAGGE